MRQRLKQALDSWRNWEVGGLQQAPRVLGRLGGGLSHQSFLVSSGDRPFAVRLTDEDSGADLPGPHVEWQALRLAHEAGLAPAPRYLDTQAGILVCDYLQPDSDGAVTPAALGTLLRRIHQLPDLPASLAVGERCERATSAIRQGQAETWRALQPLAARAAPFIAQLETAGPQATCHNDLLHANRVVSGGRLWAIDWEYAATGPVWFDLAAVCAGDELDTSARRALLENYLQAPVADRDWQRLTLFECGYRYLELLWHLRTHSAPAAASLAEKRERLQHCITLLESG
ncbi:MAG: hypothetical protein CME43_12500 [Haliea sp.]|uniref:phosphotransferase n=1 Tax=Haliea sp. TaxID=1932666 RepID=UPI000C443A34|nr:phosphotransferase [Haliea sp.]MBM70289.1 hypothetical protein [Haliea sp.]|tara:strand:+ start:287 stop:1147 length:861 start_codon:yes stop_codon:yes gene_type:complete